MMLSRSAMPMRSGLACVFAFLLTGCAGETPAGPAPAAVATAAPPVPVHWLDGDYQGERTPEAGNPDCGFEAAVGYDVQGSSIRLRTRKQRRELAGVIDASGHFSMTSADGQNQVSGSLNGGELTATETQPPHHHRHAGNVPVQGGVCTAQISAKRVAEPAAPDGS